MELFSDIELEKYADVLIWGLKKVRVTPYKKGDVVLVKFDLEAIKLSQVVYKKLLELGLNPVLELTSTPENELSFYNIASSEQLSFIAKGQVELSHSLNGLISLRAPSSLTHLKDVDSSKIASVTLSRKLYRDIWDKREERGLFGWTLCMMPTAELARHANLTIEEYASQIKKSCFLDLDNPTVKWEEIFLMAGEIKDWINSLNVDYYLMSGENMELKIYPGKMRKWIGISGHNIPSFELFISPDCTKTSGKYFSNQASYRNGNLVEGVSLEFEKGKVVKASANVGENFLLDQLKIDEGASFVGEYSLTDKRFSNIDKFMANTLFDENYGGENGNSHIAVGASYSDTFSGNKKKLTASLKRKLGFNSSALHWDLVNTLPKTVVAHLKSGKNILIYENGQFKR